MNEKPTSITAVQELIQSAPGAVWLRGGGSKPALSTPANGATALELGGLSGILEYEPAEYTFTALAGTAVADVVAALAENGQYLPFDPLLAEAGATLGGTVAANTAGSGRFRYGGVRDFILGVRFVDGRGQLVRSGGKVVKNSAGFDLPKFFVGSLGRYGVLVELTFKVFPRPQAFQTVRAAYPDLAAALGATFRLAQTSLEMDAVDLLPQAGGCTLLLRVGGLAAVLPERAARLGQFLREKTGAGKRPFSATTTDAQLVADGQQPGLGAPRRGRGENTPGPETGPGAGRAAGQLGAPLHLRGQRGLGRRRRIRPFCTKPSATWGWSAYN
jgi:glycolate oxidase FAD binding subunit